MYLKIGKWFSFSLLSSPLFLSLPVSHPSVLFPLSSLPLSSLHILSSVIFHRPVGRGVEGVRSNLPFDYQKVLYTPHNCAFKVSCRLKVVRYSFAAIENHRCPNESVAVVRAVCSRMTSAERMRKLFTPLQTKGRA